MCVVTSIKISSSSINWLLRLIAEDTEMAGGADCVFRGRMDGRTDGRFADFITVRCNTLPEIPSLLLWKGYILLYDNFGLFPVFILSSNNVLILN